MKRFEKQLKRSFWELLRVILYTHTHTHRFLSFHTQTHIFTVSILGRREMKKRETEIEIESSGANVSYDEVKCFF